MPIEYQRHDQRRLTIVTVTGPCSTDDILRVIDRQASEHAWDDARLYDLRAAVIDTSAHTEHTDLQRIADRVKVLSAGRQRGEVGIAIPPHPALFLLGLMYTTLVKDFLTIEVLLSVPQIHAWLDRNTAGGSSPQLSPTSDPPRATVEEK
jgi:hypothetical protein